MYYIAFSLGFLSSLHCLGMCGPLALAAQGMFRESKGKEWAHAVLYNSGRVITYMMLGIIFGFVGSLFAWVGFQRAISIFSGVVLLGIFAFNLQPDKLLSKIPVTHTLYIWIQKKFQAWSKNKFISSRILLGMLNGLLPCGMVYIALAGALSIQHVIGSMGFMLFFGLGTFPAMMGIMLSGKWFRTHWRVGLQKIYPLISLILGLYLIYRGVFSKIPLELNFFDAMKNPVMCH